MEPIQTLENLISTGRLPEALDFIEALPLEERQRWQVQNLTGVVCLCCGQPKEARTFFEAALEQQPDDAEVLYNLAETYASLGMKRPEIGSWRTISPPCGSSWRSRRADGC